MLSCMLKFIVTTEKHDEQSKTVDNYCSKALFELSKLKPNIGKILDLKRYDRNVKHYGSCFESYSSCLFVLLHLNVFTQPVKMKDKCIATDIFSPFSMSVLCWYHVVKPGRCPWKQVVIYHLIFSKA